jgi:hypothetical protein
MVILDQDRIANLDLRCIEARNLRLVSSSFDMYGTPMLDSSHMYFFSF